VRSLLPGGGLDELESGLVRASGELQQLISRFQACRTVLERWYGRPAHEFAERANAMLSAMVDLDGALSEAAALLRRFPRGPAPVGARR
jgi:uncharacterized protein YukE